MYILYTHTHTHINIYKYLTYVHTNTYSYTYVIKYLSWRSRYQFQTPRLLKTLTQSGLPWVAALRTPPLDRHQKTTQQDAYTYMKMERRGCK